MDGISPAGDTSLPSQEFATRQYLAVNQPAQGLQVHDVEVFAVLFALGSLKVHRNFTETTIVEKKTKGFLSHVATANARLAIDPRTQLRDTGV